MRIFLSLILREINFFCFSDDKDSEPLPKTRKLDDDDDYESPGYRKKYLPNLRSIDGPLCYKDFFDSPPPAASCSKEEDEMKRLESVIETCIGKKQKMYSQYDIYD